MITISQSSFADVLVLEIARPKSEARDRTSNFADRLFELVCESPCQQILLDLKGFSMITSDVIGQLIMLHTNCKAHDRQLKLCGVTGENRLALDVIQLHRLIDIHDSKAQAIAAFKLDEQKPAHHHVDDGSADEYLELAEAGNLDAQFRYAKCLESGRGVEQDFEAALTWFEKAAAQGHVDSQHALGVAYAYGIGVTQDIEMAFDWYKKAADQGHADSQYMIGMSLQYGLIDEVDIQRAVKWYNEAAEQGYRPAQNALAELKR